MSASEPQVLLVSDGSEVVRQSHADTVKLFEEILSTGPFSAKPCRLEVVHEDQIDTELAGISSSEYQCVVFASNALLRSSGPIVRACEDRADDLSAYLATGGAMVVLHQSIGTEPQRLLEGVLPGEVWTVPRLSFDTTLCLDWTDTTVGLPSHPNILSDADFREAQPGTWRGAFPLAYQFVSTTGPSDAWQTVGTCDSGDLMILYQDRGRSIVTSLPLDWGRENRLLQNVLKYSIEGLPLIAAVIDDDLSQSLHLDLARLAAQHPMITVPSYAAFDDLPEPVIANVELLIDLVREEETSTAQEAVVKNGGQLLRPTGLPRVGSTDRLSVDLCIGPRSSVWIAETALEDYLELDLPRFIANAPLFDSRDVVLALRPIFAVIGRDSDYMTVEVRQAIEKRCREWFEVGQGQVDQYTALVCLSLWCQIMEQEASCESTGMIPSLASLPAQSTPEASLLEAALNARLGLRTSIDSQWERLAVVGSRGDLSQGVVVRLLDAVRMSTQLLGVVPDDDQVLEAFATSAAGVLLREGDSDGLWISTEATASIVAGLASLGGVEPHADVLEVLRRAIDPLVRVFDPGASPQPLSTRLQVAGALVALERIYATGLRDLVASLLASRPLVAAPATDIRRRVDRAHEYEQISGSLRQELEEYRVESHRLKAELDQVSDTRHRADEPAVLLGRFTFTAALVLAVSLGLSPILLAIANMLNDRSWSPLTEQNYELLAVLAAAPVLIGTGIKFRLLLLPERFLGAPDSIRDG